MTQHLASTAPVQTWFFALAQEGASTPQAGAAPTQTGTTSGPVNAVGLPQGAAQPGSTQQPLSPTGGAPQGGGFNVIMLMLPILAVFMIMTLLAGRKEKKKREELMGSLKKHDKVQTTGGMIGVVEEISDTEVVLRVEQGKIRFTKSAIAGVINSAAKGSTVAEVKDGAKAAV